MAIQYYISDEAIDRSRTEPVQGASKQLSWEKLDRILRLVGELPDDQRVLSVNVSSAGLSYSIIKKVDEVVESAA